MDDVFFVGLNTLQGDLLEQLLKREIEQLEVFEDQNSENIRKSTWLRLTLEELQNCSGEVIAG